MKSYFINQIVMEAKRLKAEGIIIEEVIICPWLYDLLRDENFAFSIDINEHLDDIFEDYVIPVYEDDINTLYIVQEKDIYLSCSKYVANPHLALAGIPASIQSAAAITEKSRHIPSILSSTLFLSNTWL